MAERTLTVPLREDEAKHRGYDVFSIQSGLNFGAMKGYMQEFRFLPHAEGKLGHFVNNYPGDPKAVIMNVGRMIVDKIAALIGHSQPYKTVHGENPKELVLDEAALERRQRIVDELVEIFEHAIFHGTGVQVENGLQFTVPLDDVKNKFGVGCGTKTSVGGENLLNQSQQNFVEKRDEYLKQLEAKVWEVLRPRLLESEFLDDEDGLSISLWQDKENIFAEIVLARRGV